MKSKKSTALQSLAALLVIGVCASVVLWGWKYFATQKDGTMYHAGRVYAPQTGVYSATENVGESPVTLESDGGGEWKELHLKTWFFSLLPSQSGYGRVSASSDGTTWLGVCATVALWGWKYFATQQDGTIYHAGRVYAPQPGVYFATGNVGEYPVILKSDGGGEWKELHPKTWLFSLLPSQSEYGRLFANSDGTIWLREGENCSECRHESLGIYYSHDMGNSWASIPEKYVKEWTPLTFYSAHYGEIAVSQPHNETRFDHYHTVDGGKNWLPGALEDQYKTSEPAGFSGECPYYYRSNTASPDSDYEEYSNGKEKITVRKMPLYKRGK